MALKNSYNIKICKHVKDIILLAPEYLVIQRYSISLEDFKEIRNKLKDIKIIYDIDDDLINYFKDDSTRVETIKYLLTNSDIVTVSTNNLLIEYKQYNSNIKKIDNILNAKIWESSIRTIEKNETINILYMGSKSHYNDFLLIKNELIQLKKYYGEKVSIDIIGVMSKELYSGKEYFNYITPPEEARSSYDEFVKWISRENRWHIGIAPLEDNIFNNKKSYIKFLDYSALGLLTIASKVVPYTDVIESGINGVLVDKGEDWFDKISNYMENIEKIKKISSIAQQQFRHKHIIKDSELLKVFLNAEY
ncbi:MAG TPA: glycosyltransferase family 1 protein [Flavobacteriaceae bacterium]|nr:glycosyltransferase family 1 protein [Flavobacteriaceae bacterium]